MSSTGTKPSVDRGVLPPGLDDRAFGKALDAFRSVVRAEGVISAPHGVHSHADPYAHAADPRFLPSAVLMPADVDQVRAIVRAANTHRVPLWAVSRGRNLGYGGAAPRVNGSVVVDLRRMNRVLHVDDACAYAVVEPGVTFMDLHDHLRAGGHRLVASVPDLGWGSMIGNALDRGRGYTRYGDHAASHCGLEVVLPDGDLLRTGMGAQGSGAAWHVHPHGFGPSLDGLFFQSNLGIVTRMGVWLMPTPERYVAVTASVPQHADLEPLVDIVRDLMLQRVIENHPVIANAVTAAASFTPRSRWYDGQGPLPEAVVDTLRRETGVGSWNLRFALYGSEAVVAAQLATAKAALARIAGIVVEARGYSGDAGPADVAAMDQSQIGIPSLGLLESVNWRGRAGGHLGCSPVAPAVGREVLRQCDLLSPLMRQHGFDPIGGILMSPRSAIHVFEFVFDTEDARQVEDARRGSEALLRAASAAGWGEYRSHLEHMDVVADSFDFNGHAALRLQRRIKEALDPLGILSAGKQGVWPAGGHLASR